MQVVFDLYDKTPTFVKFTLGVTASLYIIKEALTLPRGRSLMGWSGLVVGHRGARFRSNDELHRKCQYPENTIESFIYAIENDADGIEFDIRLIKSGEYVVFHDGFINPLVRFTAPRESDESSAKTTYKSAANLTDAGTEVGEGEKPNSNSVIDDSRNGLEEGSVLSIINSETGARSDADEAHITLHKLKEIQKLGASASQLTAPTDAETCQNGGTAPFPSSPSSKILQQQEHEQDSSSAASLLTMSGKSPSLLAHEMIALNEEKAIASFDDLSLREIKQLRYVGSDRGITMPTLEEVIHLCQARNVQHVFVEIKTYSVNPLRLVEMAQAYVDFYRRHKEFMDVYTVTIAFNPLVLYLIRFLESDIAVCVLHEAEMFWENGMEKLDSEAHSWLKYVPECLLQLADVALYYLNREVFVDLVGASMYGPSFDFVEEHYMNRLFNKGICTYLWGLKKPADIDEKLKRAGVCISCDGDYTAFKEQFSIH